MVLIRFRLTLLDFGVMMSVPRLLWFFASMAIMVSLSRDEHISANTLRVFPSPMSFIALSASCLNRIEGVTHIRKYSTQDWERFQLERACYCVTIAVDFD